VLVGSNGVPRPTFFGGGGWAIEECKCAAAVGTGGKVVVGAAVWVLGAGMLLQRSSTPRGSRPLPNRARPMIVQGSKSVCYVSVSAYCHRGF
jgi:hypothetical protein